MYVVELAAGSLCLAFWCLVIFGFLSGRGWHRRWRR